MALGGITNHVDFTFRPFSPPLEDLLGHFDPAASIHGEHLSAAVPVLRPLVDELRGNLLIVHPVALEH